MIRLGLKREPYWLDLPHGVRLRVKPFATAVAMAAEATVRRQLAALAGERRSRLDLGADPGDLPDLDDPGIREGVAVELTTRALARHAVIEWEGVFGADGETPAPVSPAAIDELIAGFAEIGASFWRQYQGERDRLEAEKNASRPAPDGTTGAGRATAESAGSKAPPAPAASAG